MKDGGGEEEVGENIAEKVGVKNKRESEKCGGGERCRTDGVC